MTRPSRQRRTNGRGQKAFYKAVPTDCTGTSSDQRLPGWRVTTLCQFREAIGAPTFATHSVMYEEEAIRIVLFLNGE